MHVRHFPQHRRVFHYITRRRRIIVDHQKYFTLRIITLRYRHLYRRCTPLAVAGARYLLA